MYGDCATTVVPCNKDAVSWPAAGAKPVSLGDALPAEHPAWLRDLTTNVRRPPAAAAGLRSELGLRRPYLDPALRDHGVHGDFVTGLVSRGMARLVPAEDLDDSNAT
eukprot:9342539-Pyramimonas_sp.AAC.1